MLYLVQEIFDKMASGDVWDDEHELNQGLQRALLACEVHATTLAAEKVVVEVKAAPANGTTRGGSIASEPSSTDPLDVIHFAYSVPWPICILVDQQVDQYFVGMKHTLRSDSFLYAYHFLCLQLGCRQICSCVTFLTEGQKVKVCFR